MRLGGGGVDEDVVTWRYSKIFAMNMVFYSGMRNEIKNCLHFVFWVPVLCPRGYFVVSK